MPVAKCIVGFALLVLSATFPTTIQAQKIVELVRYGTWQVWLLPDFLRERMYVMATVRDQNHKNGSLAFTCGRDPIDSTTLADSDDKEFAVPKKSYKLFLRVDGGPIRELYGEGFENGIEIAETTTVILSALEAKSRIVLQVAGKQFVFNPTGAKDALRNYRTECSKQSR